MRLNKPISLVLFLSAAAVGATAQTLIVDDFITDSYQSPAYYSGTANRSVQTGSMIGGS